MLIWSGLDAWRAEVSHVRLSPDGVRATGTQVGAEPIAYRLDYRLGAPERFVTRELEAEAVGAGWRRRIELHHDGQGGWSCEAQADGEIDLPPPGGDVAPLGEALDCDLGLSPLTNLMPVRRHALHERPGALDFLMAWVSVPDLGVRASRQRYEHVRQADGGAVVRFLDLGIHQGFSAELELDADGLVLLYPELARRVVSPGD